MEIEKKYRLHLIVILFICLFEIYRRYSSDIFHNTQVTKPFEMSELAQIEKSTEEWSKKLLGKVIVPQSVLDKRADNQLVSIGLWQLNKKKKKLNWCGIRLTLLCSFT